MNYICEKSIVGILTHHSVVHSKNLEQNQFEFILNDIQSSLQNLSVKYLWTDSVKCSLMNV